MAYSPYLWGGLYFCHLLKYSVDGLCIETLKYGAFKCSGQIKAVNSSRAQRLFTANENGNKSGKLHLLLCVKCLKFCYLFDANGVLRIKIMLLRKGREKI